MNSVFFLILIFCTCQFIYADLVLEERQKENNIYPNKSEWMTKDLFDLELSTIKKMETIAHPLLDEIRLEAEVSRKAGNDPSECIHKSSKTLLSTVDEFYIELDNCNLKDNHANNLEDASACDEKLISAFKSTANGARDYFKHCIKQL